MKNSVKVYEKYTNIFYNNLSSKKKDINDFVDYRKLIDNC